MILWSLRDGEAGNLMFDGGSICELLHFNFQSSRHWPHHDVSFY
jgi:hypothetical protein